MGIRLWVSASSLVWEGAGRVFGEEVGMIRLVCLVYLTLCSRLHNSTTTMNTVYAFR